MIVEIEVDLVLLLRDQHLVVRGQVQGADSIVILQSGRDTLQNCLEGGHLNDSFNGLN